MDFYQQLKNELANLPGEIAHTEMFPLRAKTSDALKTESDYKLSGVLALLYHTNNTPQIILTERQIYEGKHSGQMSFPGGKKEDTDDSTLAAALRETHEEIGIAPDKVNFIGALSEVYIPVSKFLVHPYLGYLNETPQFVKSEREVKSIITFDVKELIKDSNRIVTNIPIGNGTTIKNVPAFYIQEKVIWGATALMLNEIRIILNRMNK